MLNLNNARLITTEITASAFAGVGNPLNVVACVESRLNIASLKAAHTGIMAGNHHRISTELLDYQNLQS